MAAGQGCEGGGRDRGQGDGGGKDQGQGGVGVGEVAKAQQGMGTPCTGWGGAPAVRTWRPEGRPSPTKTPSATPPGARSNGTPSAAGQFGVAADSASMPAPPGVSPFPRRPCAPIRENRSPPPRSSPSVQPKGSAPPHATKPGGSQAGGGSLADEPYPGLGVRRVSGVPVACFERKPKADKPPGFSH